MSDNVHVNQVEQGIAEGQQAADGGVEGRCGRAGKAGLRVKNLEGERNRERWGLGKISGTVYGKAIGRSI